MGTAKRERQKAGRQARLEAQEAEQSAAKRKRTVIRGAILLVAFIAVAFGISRLVRQGQQQRQRVVRHHGRSRRRHDGSRQHRHHGGRCEHDRGVHRFDRHDDRREGHHRRHALPADRRLGRAHDVVREGTADVHRPGEEVHGGGRHQLRQLHHRARPQGRAEDGEQLRRALAVPLLRRHHVPPRRCGLRDPVRRPEGRRHRRPGLRRSRTSSPRRVRTSSAHSRWRTPGRTRTAASSS